MTEISSADSAELAGILHTFDGLFSPPISEKPGGVESFADKLGRFGVVLVASGPTGPAGFAAIYANDLTTREAFMTFLAVLPESQGAGLGARLVEESCAVARDAGMHTMRLQVRDDNLSAIRLYQRLGFEWAGAADGSHYRTKAL